MMTGSCLLVVPICAIEPNVTGVKRSSTTKYTSSTTNYYEVLQNPLQYYKVLQSITSYYKKPASTAKYYSGTTPYYKVLNLQQLLHLPRKVTLDLHQVLRLPRKVTLDLHQVLRLPHRMTRRLDPRHIWNVISNVRRNKCHTPNSPNTAPATQNDHATSGRNLRKTAEMSFPMRGRSEHDPRMIRSRSETVCVSPQPATQQRFLFALRTNGLYWKIQRFALRLSFQISPSTAPTTKSNTWTSPSTAPTTKNDTWTSPSTAPTTKVTLELHQVLRLPRKVTLELHQVLRLPRKVTLDLHQVLRLPRKVTLDLHQVLRLPHRMTRRLDPRHIWNVISNVRRNKCHPPNSPNTAPATQNNHATSGRNLRKTAETSFPMRGRSEHDPRMIRSRSETVSVSPQPATQQRLLFALQTNGLYWKIQHFALRLSFQISPSTAPTTKSNTWTSPSTAPTTKSDTWPSPSTAPATQNDSQAWSSSHMKRHFQCAEKQMSHSKLTKYCACHAKWPCNIWQKFAKNSWNVISNARPIRAWSENDPITFRDRLTVSPQPATQQRLLFALQTNGLYWKIQHFALRLSFQISPSTAPTTKSNTWTSPSTAPTTKSDTWPSPSTARLYLTLLLRSDCTWLYSYRLYLTLLLRSDCCNWLYYYAAILLIDSTITHRLYLTLLLRSDCTWLYYYAPIVLDSTITQRL